MSYASNTAILQDSLKVDSSNNFIERKPINKIHQKYNGRDYNYEESLKEETLNAWQRFKLWLGEILKEMFNFDTPDGSVKAVNIILRIFGVLIILFVLYKIASAYMNKDGNWVFGRKSDTININSIEIDTNIHQTDFYAMVEESVLKNDYRSAIRYYYLLSLKRLSNKEIIEWDSEKTNYDYYQEIKNTEVQKQFQYISYLYDYCWYGEFNIERQEFDASEKAFKKLFSLI